MSRRDAASRNVNRSRSIRPHSALSQHQTLFPWTTPVVPNVGGLRPRWLSLPVAGLVWLGALAPAAAQRPAGAPQRDSTQRRDSAAVILAPVDVRSSIIPVAGPTIGSGVP